MPTAVGPNTKGEENLVFGYDLGDVINSYKGEPTVNLIPDNDAKDFEGGTDGYWSYQTVAGSGSISTENPKSGTYSAKLTRQGSGGEVNYWWNVGPALSLTPGTTYTFSMDVWCDKPGMARLFSYLAGTNSNSDFHPGDSKWHRLSMQFIPAVSTSAAQIRFGLVTSNSNYPVTAYFDNAQVEQKTHATPFTADTRSATQGLVDLTGNSTIDLSNVSFDSKAQMTFDGSNDYASLGTVPLTSGASTYTIEAVFRADSTKVQVIWEQNSSGVTQHQRACMILLSNGYGGFNGQSNDFHSVVPYSTGVWYHWIITVDKNAGTNPIKVYVNGSLYAQGDSSTGASNLNVGTYGAAMGYKLNQSAEYFDGDIKLVKVYNRVLTSAEALANYNAIKGRFLI